MLCKNCKGSECISTMLSNPCDRPKAHKFGACSYTQVHIIAAVSVTQASVKFGKCTAENSPAVSKIANQICWFCER